VNFNCDESGQLSTLSYIERICDLAVCSVKSRYLFDTRIHHAKRQLLFPSKGREVQLKDVTLVAFGTRGATVTHS
jgi:hypothetical protein